MSAPDLTRFDDLLSRYLDASLASADEQELLRFLADEALAARFHEATRLSTEIAGILAGSIRDDVMIRLVASDLGETNEFSPLEEPYIRKDSWPAFMTPSAKKPRTPLWLALAAMVVILAGVSAYYFAHTPAPAPTVTALATPVPEAVDVPAKEATPKEAGTRVSSLRGTSYLIRPDGRIPLTNGLALNDGGTVQTVGRRSRATVILRDGSEIELKGDTTLTAELGPGERRLLLQQGMIVATVTKQPENTPLIFNTDRATATVRGTQLAMVRETSGTYLIVIQGSVALQRASGGPEVLIDAGFYGHVELEGQFHPFPISLLPRALQEELPEP